MGLEIREMTRGDLERALGWAREEGWNPGEDDAAAFFAADPGGFLMGWIGEAPVSAISVVRYGLEAGYLGLYIVRPEFRGQGHGWAIWQAGMAHLGARAVGLDGVLAQQDKYRRSGFTDAFSNIRMTGQIAPGQRAAPLGGDLADALAYDRSVSGFDRPSYMRAWLSDAPSRLTRWHADGGNIRALGTVRRCAVGCKVGPLYAEDDAAAMSMLESLAAEVPDEALIVDVPEGQQAFLATLESLGFTASFGTARMYKGAPPATDLTRLFGQATLELG